MLKNDEMKQTFSPRNSNNITTFCRRFKLHGSAMKFPEWNHCAT